MDTTPAINSRDFWDAKFQQQWEDSNGPRYTRCYAAAFLAFLPEWVRAAVADGGSICDWGCAQGDAVDLLQDRFPAAAVTGVDFSPAAIRRAGERFPTRAFRCEDWTKPARDAKPAVFDLVFSSHTLEHFSNTREILWKVLAAHARRFIALLLPYDEDPRKRDPEHFDSFTRESFELVHGDWICVRFEVIPPEDGGGMYAARQCLVVYANRAAAALPVGLAIASVAGAGEFRKSLDALAADKALLEERRATAEAKRTYQMECDKQILASSQRLNDALQTVKDGLAREKAARETAAAENTALQKSFAVLSAKLPSAAAEKAAAEAKAADLAEKFADLTAKYEALQARFDAAQADRETRLLAAAEAKAAATAEAAVLAEKRTALQTQLDSATAERTALQTSLGESQSKASALQTQLNSATAERAALQTSLSESQSKASALQSALDSATTENATLHSSLDTVTAERTNLQTMLDATQTDLAALQSNLGDCQTENATLHSSLDSAAAERTALQESISTLEAQLAEARAEAETCRGADHDALVAKIAGIQAELDAEKAWTLQHTAEATALRVSLDGARAEIARQKAALQTASAATAKAAESLAVASARGEAAAKEAAALKASLLAAQQTAQEVQQTLAATQKALQSEKDAAAAKAREFAAQKMRFEGEKAEWESIKRCRAYRVAQFYWDIRNPLAAKLHNAFHSPSKPKAAAPAARPAPQSAPAPDAKTTSPAVSLPTPKAAPAAPPRKLKIASVLDTFSDSCFGNEADLVRIRPDNWRDILAAEKPDMLLVESAWNGNDGAWQYLIGTYGGSTRDKLRELIAECRKLHIPTAFWNKEDPPHFDKFIEAAALFDHVFTTDENCLPAYRERCGHDRVSALPFAASPVIHNPFVTAPRDRDVCFAGTYYANRFEDRRKQMDVLLECAREFKFDIYDRMYGNKAPGYENYLFPERFREFIRGRLDYSDMLKAYRGYKVFLNTNSVVDSGTMFSRRVFELLACGTPVVTTPSVGIRRFFGPLVGEITDVEKGRAQVRRLLTDAEHYRRIQAAGIREVLGKHTYAIRLETMAEALGFSWRRPVCRMAVFAVPGRDGADGIAAMLSRQTLRPAAVVLSRKNASLRAKLAAAGFDVHLCDSPDAPELAAAGINAAAWMDASCHYGPGYLLDASLAMLYDAGALSGMAADWQRRSGRLVLAGRPNASYTRAGGLLAATVAASAPQWAAAAPAMRAAFDAGLRGTVDLQGFVRPPFEFSTSATRELSSKDLSTLCL